MANAIRFLSIDAVNKANSGHPGMPLGMADVATVLFAKFLNHNPEDPNRDRFVLSNGHGSMLLYSILYLTGYINIDELKNFRQLGSKTPGHPEYGLTPGVEATTGPLGQGFACAVGMALAESILRAHFGKNLIRPLSKPIYDEKFLGEVQASTTEYLDVFEEHSSASTTKLPSEIEFRKRSIDHYTYVMLGDGCLMEGISHEAASLAGHLKLNKLIALFDDNDISIDGTTALSCSDDIEKRFLAYGWNVCKIDGHDFDAISLAIEQAQKSDKPFLICCRTIIGKFSSRAGTSAAHSGAFSEEDVKKMREELNWHYEPFHVPEDIKNEWKKIVERAKLNCNSQYTTELQRRFAKRLPDGLDDIVTDLKKQIHELIPHEATRSSFGRVMEVLTKSMPELIGGSADLTGSNCTKYKHMQVIDSNNYDGSYVHYGVREHTMAAYMNGMALHGGILPYGGTFLVFSDYCRPSIRLSALMKQQVMYIMTHDSIGVGEDGPTHQPVEHLASLRAIPNLYVFRPADAAETLECISIALKKKESPALFALSRQNVNYVRKFANAEQSTNLSEFGAYILCEHSGKLDVTIFATGSEVEIAVAAYKKLQEKGIGTRVISMPCWRIFDEQNDGYKATILNNNSIKVAIEAGSDIGWHKYIGSNGIFIGMKSFGESAPCKTLYEHFNINSDYLIKCVQEALLK
jgi:transketolase